MLIDKISAGCGITAKLGIEDVALQACNAGSSSGDSHQGSQFLRVFMGVLLLGSTASEHGGRFALNSFLLADPGLRAVLTGRFRHGRCTHQLASR